MLIIQYQQVGFLANLQRANIVCLIHCLGTTAGGIGKHVFWLWQSAGNFVIALNAFQ